jgi:hypothetical protein
MRHAKAVSSRTEATGISRQRHPFAMQPKGRQCILAGQSASQLVKPEIRH